MEILAQIVSLIHGASNLVIIAIIACTVGMSMFLLRVLTDNDFFSTYDRNL